MLRSSSIFSSSSALIADSFKPQLKTVGPKYGKFLGQIRNILSSLDGNKAKSELDADGAIKFDVDGNEIVLTEDDLLIDVQQKEGYFSVSDKYTTVALSITLTPELVEEGFVNEIVSKLQTMRKDSDFNVTDHIIVYVDGNEKLEKIIKDNEVEIYKIVLADKFEYSACDSSKEWNINGEKVNLAVKKL